ncbi:hypothetical protein IAT38_001849 [Cryptococcus sp. DSM 104549]
MEIWRGRPRPLEIGGSEKEDGLGQKKKREGLDQAVAVPRPNPTQHTRVLSLVDWEGYYTLCYQDSHFEPPNTTPLSAHLHLPASLLVTASATSLAQRPGGGPHHLFANRSPLSYFSRNTLHYIVPVAVCVDIPTWEELMELDKYELLNMGLRECLELDMQEMLRLLFKGLPRVTFHVRASKGQLFPVTMLETTWERNGCEVTYDIEISEEDPMQTRVIAKQVVAAFARIYSYSGRRKPRFIVPYRKELPELVEDMLMKYREPMRTKCRESITMRGEGGEECVCKTPMCPRGLLPVMVHDERPREVVRLFPFRGVCRDWLDVAWSAADATHLLSPAINLFTGRQPFQGVGESGAEDSSRYSFQ